jgi:chromosome segregation ATPase
VANEKNNINELVFDDDPTAELEVIALRRGNLSSLAAPLECDEHTSDLENTSDFESTSDLEKRGGDDAQIVSKLQYDIEQLRARRMGLEAENKAREEVTTTLTAELHKIRDALAAKNDLLVSRNEEIESLKSELRKQEAQYHATVTRQEQEIADMRETMRFIPEPAAFAPTQADDADDQTRHQRTEAYADSLRHKLQDLLTLHDNLKREHRRLEASLQQSDENGQQLAAKLAVATEGRDALTKELASISDKHAEEIRLLRFELGEAQDTVAQSEELNSQLAADLVDTHGFKKELEQMLCDKDTMSRARIDELEQELIKTRRASRDLEEKLEARGDAINVMLAELARNAERIESIPEADDGISDVDEQIAEQFEEATDNAAHANRTNERVTRMLLGKTGDKLLRFPLFKDRLTIGRTKDNDIQLNTAYISRRHAVVQTDGDATRVIDWGSRNGVFVNSKRVTEHFLKNGDIVAIGNVHFRYDERPKRDN